MSLTQPDVTFDWVSEDDLSAAIELEVQGFPHDEAANLETFRYRQSNAGDLFLGAYLPASEPERRKLVGYVCSTRTSSKCLTRESMSHHQPGTSSICIHSICISPSHQREGLGLALLKEYLSRLETARRENSAPNERVLLITHEELRPFYEKAGFEWVGPSTVVHGSRLWFEMRRILEVKSQEADSASLSGSLPPFQLGEQPQLPAGFLEVLQGSNRSRPMPKPLSSFSGGLTDVLSEDPDNQGVLSNRCDLLCPRAGCGSIILKANTAKWVERDSVQMEPLDQPTHPVLPMLPPAPQTTQWWLVTPSPMAFENIGFSRPAPSIPPSSSGKRLKLLACAECDLGPLGWCEEGGTEFWLACARVGYRA